MKKLVVLDPVKRFCNFFTTFCNFFMELILLVLMLVISVIFGAGIYILIGPWALYVILGISTVFSLFNKRTAAFSLSGIAVCGLALLLMGHITTSFFLIIFIAGALLWIYSMDETFRSD